MDSTAKILGHLDGEDAESAESVSPEIINEEVEQYIAGLKQIFKEKNMPVDQQELIISHQLSHIDFCLNMIYQVTADNLNKWIEDYQTSNKSISNCLGIIGLEEGSSDYLELRKSMTSLPLAQKVNKLFAEKLTSIGTPTWFDEYGNPKGPSPEIGDIDPFLEPFFESVSDFENLFWIDINDNSNAQEALGEEQEERMSPKP